MGAAPRADQSVGQLLGMLAADSGNLVRQELRLAQYEVVERSRVQAARAGIVLLGGGLAQTGLIGLLVAAAIGMTQFMPLWASALVCGAVFFFIGVGVAMSGLNALKKPIEEVLAPLQSTSSRKDGQP